MTGAAGWEREKRMQVTLEPKLGLEIQMRVLGQAMAPGRMALLWVALVTCLEACKRLQSLAESILWTPMQLLEEL